MKQTLCNFSLDGESDKPLYDEQLATSIDKENLNPTFCNNNASSFAITLSVRQVYLRQT